MALPVPKTYPIEYAEPLEALDAKEPPEGSQFAACFNEEDIRIIKRNIKKLSKWGIANQNTLERVNQEAK